MLKANAYSRNLLFRKPSGTSRGVLTEKPSWYITIEDESGTRGIGECSILSGLSPESGLDMTETIRKSIHEFNQNGHEGFTVSDQLPALRFAFETAMRDFTTGGQQVPYPSSFTQGKAAIPINGLIWMNNIPTMLDEFKQKVHKYPCIKIKVGALDVNDEIQMLESIRASHGQEFEIRLDANEAFELEEALSFLHKIAHLNIHSIEQPIKRKRWKEMAELVTISPIDIALDEELIGVTKDEDREQLLNQIKPAYIIIKPSLIGGLEETKKWTELCVKHQIDWWVTSALESNIGLNAIAQWSFLNATDRPQGLGTGQLFENNINSPLFIADGHLHYNPQINWKIDEIFSS